MQNTYTAVVKKDGQWWIGWIEEIPGVNCQEATREELIETLKVTLGEALDLNRQDAIDAALPNPAQNLQSAVPRHTEISDNLAKKICKDLGIPPVG